MKYRLDLLANKASQKIWYIKSDFEAVEYTFWVYPNSQSILVFSFYN